jgi:hypothetical protein
MRMSLSCELPGVLPIVSACAAVIHADVSATTSARCGRRMALGRDKSRPMTNSGREGVAPNRTVRRTNLHEDVTRRA